MSDFFGGAASLSWAMPNPDGSGDYIDDPTLLNVVRGGQIVDAPVEQQSTDMNTGELKWWDKEKTRPVREMIVKLRCDGTAPDGANFQPRDERDESDPSDDGERRLYIRGQEQINAIRAAFKAKGKKGIEPGAYLFVAWTGKRPAKQKGFKPAKTWASVYFPPVYAPSDDNSPFGGSHAVAEKQIADQGLPSANPFGGSSAVPPTSATTEAPAPAGGNPFGAAPAPAGNPFG